MTQLSLFDQLSDLNPGDYVKTLGPPIPASRWPDYIGKLVVTDVSTESYIWYRVARLERVHPKDEVLGLYTAILSTGQSGHYSYITNYPWGGAGYEIHELRPCDEKNDGYIERETKEA